MKTISSHKHARALGLGIAGAALSALLMSACTSDKSPTGSSLCGNNNELCVPRAQLIDTGAKVFADNCVGCHGEDGRGGRGPTVANSDYVMGDTKRLIKTVLHGIQPGDTIMVNGLTYPGGGMSAWEEMLSHTEIAGILTYFRGQLNDSLVTNCVVNPQDEFDVTCTKTARTQADMNDDSVAVWEVKAMHDSIGFYTPVE